MENSRTLKEELLQGKYQELFQDIYQDKAGAEAQNSSSTSLAGTCSRLVNGDTHQNSTMAPAMRKNVSTSGSSSSGISERETGVLKPNITLAANKAMWPGVLILFMIV